jgi:hypothetical protein
MFGSSNIVSYGGAPTIAMEGMAGVQQQYAAPVQQYAAPVTYAAAAPTVVETVAAPMTYAQPVSYAAPMVETIAAPAVTYAAAPVVETIAAPAVTYAQPMSYAAPMIETIAAPAVTYTQAAPITTQVASYVAPPVQQQYVAPLQQQIQAPPAVPAQPRKLTEGIPTPDQIAAQKAGYSAALDKQLKEAIETVQKETTIEKEMIKFTSEKTIAMYNMQVDEKLSEAMASADEQATLALLELNKAKVERNLQLNAQASGLVMDYEMKAVQTELAQKQYDFQVKYVGKENKLAEEYNAQVAKANTGTTYSTYSAPQTVVR